MKTKKLLSFMLAIVMVVSMMATLGITASAKPASDKFIKVGETQVIRTEGVYSSEAADGNYYYISVAEGGTPSVPKNNISIESVDQDGNDMVITIKGVAVTDEDEIVDIVAKVYSEDESDWVDVAIQCGYHVVTAEDAEYLDLDENTAEILDSKKLDQNYNLTVEDGVKTNVTKVKVEWTISDIYATRKDAKVWNPDTLTWVDDSANNYIEATDTTATFTITNLSSVSVDVQVDFEAEEGFDPTLGYTGVDADTHKTTIASVVKSDMTVDTTINHKATVSIDVVPNTADFATISATTSATKYGTYIVTLCDSCEVCDPITTFNDELLSIFDKNDFSEILSMSSDEIASVLSANSTAFGNAYNNFCAIGESLIEKYGEDCLTIETMVVLEDGTVAEYSPEISYKLPVYCFSCTEHSTVVIVPLNG